MLDVNVSRKAFLSAALLSAWSFLPPRAFALDASPGKPQISINKQYLEITVTVDPSLQPFAGLFASCLAEGKVWADKHDSESAAEWRDNRQAFRALQWFYERDYAWRSTVGHYISVVPAMPGSTAVRIRTSVSTRFYGTIPRESASAFARSSPKRRTTARQ